MSTVLLSFSPDPAYVRTIRLVAAAAARRAGVPVELLDELRLAIGEACTRAVALHRRHRLPDLIDVVMTEGARFTVRVIDRSPGGGEPNTGSEGLAARVAVDSGRATDDEEALANEVGIALLTGLVADLAVEPITDGKGTEVRMSWPIARR
jgi:serine/threonine-protein kinase RsbW